MAEKEMELGSNTKYNLVDREWSSTSIIFSVYA